MNLHNYSERPYVAHQHEAIQDAELGREIKNEPAKMSAVWVCVSGLVLLTVYVALFS